MLRQPTRLLLGAALVAAQLVPLPAGAQGFGKIKKKVTLHRKLPAVAHVAGDRISVRVTAEQSKDAELAKTMRDVLETEILKNEKAHLSVDESHPDTLIVCKITSCLTPPPKMVTRSAFNGKNFSNQQFAEVNGSMTVAYEAKDLRSGRLVDSDNVSARYAREFNAQSGTMTAKTLGDIKKPFSVFHKKSANQADEEPDTAPNQAELQQLLMNRSVKDITARLVDTDENVEVDLARGKLDDANRLADQGLWSRMAEQLETMAPLPRPEGDAYRLYNLGVAYEALGYDAKDSQAAKHFLQQAAINYGKAIDDNQGEKYFLEPQQRIETAMAHYKVLEGRAATTSSPPVSQQAAPAAVSGAPPSLPPPPPPQTPGTPGRASTRRHSSTAATKISQKAGVKPLSNDDVITLAKAGMDEENLIATIREAAAVNFDMSTQGQVNLLKNGIKGKVLASMRERARRSSE